MNTLETTSFFIDGHPAAIEEVVITRHSKSPETTIKITGDMPQSAKIFCIRAKNKEGAVSELKLFNLVHKAGDIWIVGSLNWWAWV